MPYVQRVTWFPATGKDAEMRALIEERVRALQAAGVRSSMHQAVYSEDRPAFSHTLSFDDLAALEAHRASAIGLARVQIAPALARQGPRIELYEALHTAQAGSTPRYIHRTIRQPLAGKSRPLSSLLVERAKALEAQGIRSNVQVRVAGGSGSVSHGVLLQSLAELEKVRQLNRTDPKFTAQLEELHQGAPTLEMVEILIPMQPS